MMRMIKWMWVGLIAVLTLLPSDRMEVWAWTSILGLDKLAHMFVFAVLYWLHAISETRSGNGRKLYQGFALFAVIYGVVLEVLQSLMYLGRHFDVLDIIANIIGLLIAVLVVSKLHK